MVSIRTSALILTLFCAAAGCDGEADAGATTVDGSTGNVAPMTEGDWYRPQTTTTWQWQLQGPVNTGYDVEVYDIDLFESDAALISSFHAAGRRVVCYFSAGTAEDFRPDFARFANGDLGRALEDFPDERWVDIRSEGVLTIMLERLDLAVSKGCDGVEPDNVTAFLNDTGFPITAGDQLAFNRNLANEAHRRGLAVGLKNDGEQAAELVEYFDFSLNEQCHEFDECEQLNPFLQLGKPVWNAEYAEGESAARALAASLCPRAQAEGIRTLVLPVDLDDAFRISCDE